jgi:prophage regulatory protein
MTTARIIRLPQVKERIGLSRSTIYSLIQQKKLKAPISLGARAVGWLESDISEFIEQRIKASRDSLGKEEV